LNGVTVVIGVRCSDGIVLGSDSAASLMSQGMVTAQQRSMKKVAANGRVLSGVAGDTGLGQRIRAYIEERLNAGRWTGDRQAIMTQMRRDLLNSIVRAELEAAEAAVKTFGHQSCADAARTETLVATVIDDRPELIRLNESCAPTLIEDDVPFCSIGGGQLTADPFLAFARRILWPSQAPTVVTATVSVAWTLTHVIHANPNGIGDPIQLGVLQRDGGDWIARELTKSEITENRQSVLEAEEGFRDWFYKKDESRSATRPPR
jgi:20S proteasome alpha/beta subunit